MPGIIDLNRDLLINRHWLSHQQIDELLHENFSEKHLSWKLQSMKMVGEFIQVSEFFNEKEIEHIPIKGPLLSYRLYKDPSFRFFSDLDFLMDMVSVKKAIAILKDQAYSMQHFEWPGDIRGEKLLRKHTNQVSLYNPEKGIKIELHWDLFKYQLAEKKIIGELIESNLVETKYAGHKFQVFNNEFELLYLIIHGGFHAWQRLKWLVDVNKYLKDISIDQSRFSEMVEALKAHRMIALCNALLSEYFPGDKLLPQKTKVSKFLLSYSKQRISAENELTDTSLRGRMKFHRFKMSCFPGCRLKMSVIKHILTSSDLLKSNKPTSKALNHYAASILKKIKHLNS